MMTYLVMAIVLLLSALLQIEFPSYAIIGGAKMPFLLPVVLYYALSRDGGVMVVSALFAGFLQDALSGIPLGYSSLLFCFIGWGAGRFRDYVLIDSVLTSVFFGSIAGVIFTLSICIMLMREGLLFCSTGILILRMLGTGFLAMISTPVIFGLARILDQLVGNIDLEEDIDVIEY